MQSDAGRIQAEVVGMVAVVVVVEAQWYFVVDSTGSASAGPEAWRTVVERIGVATDATEAQE